MQERLLAPRTYVLVCLALLVLTGLTVGLAFVDLRGWNAPVAFAIAAAKAVLVATFFMHLRYGHHLPRLVAGAALLWLGIMLLGTLDDVLTRGWLAVPGK